MAGSFTTVKYGDIPKGSYTGGSTYTVKRGDTLFYIAWITGNDFRDLAQRNNVQAPYASGGWANAPGGQRNGYATDAWQTRFQRPSVTAAK